MISISLSSLSPPHDLRSLSSLFPHAQEKRPASYLLLHLLHSSSPPLSSRSTLQFLDLGSGREAAAGVALPSAGGEPMGGMRPRRRTRRRAAQADVAAEAQEDAGAAVHETIAAAAA